MDQKIVALQAFFAAINRNDMQAISAHFDLAIVRIEPPGFPSAGTYRGIEAVREHVRFGRATWAEGSCETEGFFVNGEKVVVYLYAWVRLHGATEWMGGRFADGFTFRDGCIVDYLSFGERSEAMAWAGIDNE